MERETERSDDRCGGSSRVFRFKMIIVADQGVCVLIVVVAQVIGWNGVGPACLGVHSWTWRIVGNSLGSSVSVGIGWIRLQGYRGLLHRS